MAIARRTGLTPGPSLALLARGTRGEGLAALLLAIFAVLVYAPLVLQGRVLASLDAEVYFYPHAAYLASRLAAGQLPLWDPYTFAGVPFLANSQVGALYPPNWLYLLGPISRVYSWLVVLHVWWLGVGVYLLGGRSLQLSWLGALVAALAVSGGGYVGGMVGHLNQLEALAWGPLAILGVERAVARHSWRIALLASLPFLFLILAGHTQVLYIVGVAAGLAGLARVVAGPNPGVPSRPPFPAGEGEARGAGSSAKAPPSLRGKGDGGLGPLPQLARLAIGPALGAVLAAPQLLPMLELTRLGIRSGGLDFADAAAFSFPPIYALTGLLPTVAQAPPSTEWLGYVGLTTVLLAGLALAWRPTSRTLLLAAFALAGLILALGQYTPIYAIVFKVIPGLDLFRVPARWLAWWTLGAALLAGRGVDVLLEGKDTSVGEPHPPVQEQVLLEADELASADVGRGSPRWRSMRQPAHGQRELNPGKGSHGGLPLPTRFARFSAPGFGSAPRSRVAALALAVAATLALAAVAYHDRRIIAWPAPPTLGLWLAVVVGFAILVGLGRRWRGVAEVGLLALLATELIVAAGALPTRDAVWPDAVESPRPSVDHLLAARTSDRVLALGDNSYDPGDLSNLRTMLDPTLPENAVAAYITALKHVEGLTPNLPLRFGLRALDGYDGGVLPLDRYNQLKRLFPLQGKDVPDGRLRLQLTAAPDPRLLGWLNVHYLVMDRLRDRWIDGVYYDLGVSEPLGPGQSVTLRVDQPFPATDLGAAIADPSGLKPTGILDVESLGPGGASARLDAASGQPIQTDVDRGGVWLGRSSFNRPAEVQTVRLTWRGADLITLRSLSLIDERGGTSIPVVVNPAYHLDFLGDMKIYRNDDTLPRAFLTTALDLAPSLDAAISRMRQPDWDAQRAATAVTGEVAPSLAFAATGAPGETRIVEDRPEKVVVATQASGPRLLVLTDSYYPGWQATVDGKSATILPVDVLFRGVLLPPGSHQVIFTYAPASWRLGLLLGALGALALVGGLAAPEIRRRLSRS